MNSMKTIKGLFQAVGQSAIDRDVGVIRGVSVITEGEADGHDFFIDATTIKQVEAAAKAFKGGVKVKMNHWSGVESIVGFLRDFRIDGVQLRADLHLLKTSDRREYIIEMAESIPDGFGLSIAFSGIPEEIDGKVYARCKELYSVDLVDSPAANPSGLFSQVDTETNMKGKQMDATEQKSFIDSIRGFFTKAEKGLVPAEQLSAAQTQIATLTASLTERHSQLESVKQECADTKQKLQAKDAEINLKTIRISELEASLAQRDTQGKDKTANADASLSAAKAKVTELQGIIDNPEGAIQKSAAAKAQEILAAAGHTPIKGDSTKNGDQPEKPDFSKLKGLTKVIAIEKAESAAKQKNN